MRLTANLFCQSIEPSLPFWRDALKFELTAEVPHGNALGFVILQKGDAEVMLQTIDSVREDAPTLLGPQSGHEVCLFLEVPEFETAREALQAYETVLEERVTNYGMREIGKRAPSGHLVLVASKVEPS